MRSESITKFRTDFIHVNNIRVLTAFSIYLLRFRVNELTKIKLLYVKYVIAVLRRGNVNN